MSTSTAVASSSAQLSALKDKLSRISAMRRLWLVTFRCMSEQATLPDGKLELAGATEEKINEYIDTIHKVTVFPRERLTPLRRICYEVYRELKDKGLLLGNSGAYIIPNKYTQEVQFFLDRKAREYREVIARITADYKSIYDDQVRLATQDIADVTLRNVIIDLIPTKDEFVKRTYCSYAPYALALSDSDGMEAEDLEMIARNVEEVHEEENRRFLGKIHDIFAAYLPRLDAELAVNHTARMSLLNSVCKRANEAFSRLDFTLRGTSVYADLQAMNRFYQEGVVSVVTYMENIARGQDIPDFLAKTLRAKVDALSSPVKFRDCCKLAAAPQTATEPQKAEVESFSISGAKFGDDESTKTIPEYREESFDISSAIKAVKDLQMPQDNPEAAAPVAANSGSDPQVLTNADHDAPVAVIPCDPLVEEDREQTAPAAAAPVTAAPVVTSKEQKAVSGIPVPPIRSSLASRFSIR